MLKLFQGWSINPRRPLRPQMSCQTACSCRWWRSSWMRACAQTRPARQRNRWRWWLLPSAICWSYGGSFLFHNLARHSFLGCSIHSCGECCSQSYWSGYWAEKETQRWWIQRWHQRQKGEPFSSLILRANVLPGRREQHAPRRCPSAYARVNFYDHSCYRDRAFHSQDRRYRQCCRSRLTCCYRNYHHCPVTVSCTSHAFSPTPFSRVFLLLYLVPIPFQIVHIQWLQFSHFWPFWH